MLIEKIEPPLTKEESEQFRQLVEEHGIRISIPRGFRVRNEGKGGKNAVSDRD